MTREQAKLLLPIIAAFAEGKDIEFNGVCGWIPVDSSPSFREDPAKYRIKPLEFPKPPPGEEWVTGNLTAEQFGIQGGWRPFLKSQVRPSDWGAIDNTQFWTGKGWSATSDWRLVEGQILRTQAPLAAHWVEGKFIYV